MATKLAPLIVIVGPTASGKSSLALEIAQKYDGEIICADSRTVYKGMDIGTAKPTRYEQDLIPHHLLDVVRPSEAFTVADFKKLANDSINDILSRDRVPIMVGGSGLYIDSVIFNYSFSDGKSPRDKVNPRHLSSEVPKTRSDLRSNTIIVGLDPSLEVLKQRICSRVNSMIENGFINEVQELFGKYTIEIKALQAPGYKAFWPFIENKISLEEAKSNFIRNDYLLARRQRTWFRRNKSIHWFKNRGKAVEFLTTELNKKQ